MTANDESEYFDIYPFINSTDPSYLKEFPFIYNYINSISVDADKLSHIQLIINTSHYWQFDLAFVCLIDNCDKNTISLDIHPHKLRQELANICYNASDYNIVEIIESLLILQNRYGYFRHLRYLIEICIYLQTGPAAVDTLITLSKVQSMNFEDFLIKLKFLWVEKFLPELINHYDAETIRKSFHHENHFLQCNIQIVQLFITSIPVPYENITLIQLFDYFIHEKNTLSLKELESFLAKSIGKLLETCVNQLCVSICTQYIPRQIKYIPPKIHANINYCIERMQSSWTLDNICELMSIARNDEALQHLNSLLTIIVDYGLMFDRTIFDFNRNPCQLSQIVHSYAIQVSFSNEVRTFQLNKLINEIIDKTYTQSNIEEKTKEKQDLFKQYRHLSASFSRFSSMDRYTLKAQLISIRNSDFYCRVAFVMRVSDVVFEAPIRCIQKLAILLALNSSNTSARILQIETGEGKTRLISVIAVVKALEKIQVDVITSSKELAKLHIAKLKEFYEFFNLTVGCNADLSAQNHVYGRKRKKRSLASKFVVKLGIFKPIYECDVIYGSVDDFQAHILQDEFNETGLRCNRRCELALVDEAVSVMIDGREQISRLATLVPSVFYLLPIKGLIWTYISNLRKIVRKVDGKWCKYYQDENGNIGTELLEKSIIDFAEEVYLPALKASLHSTDEVEESENKLIIPKHLHKLTLAKLSTWIRNAAYAKFEMKEGFDYVLRNNKIIYIDTNTGLLHETMRYTDCLHFFLEMKHGCAIQSEEITTNFISNVAFFRRYSHNLIGFTGTIGGAASQRIFREAYSANCIIIPPFRERLHLELRPYFATNNEAWFDYITYSAKEKMKQNRAVLIITKYIEEAKTIAELLREHFPNNVKLYSENEERNVVRELLQAGWAIVATNIAGRGTDIHVSDTVEKNGGLHVTITSLPDNDRIEQQNQGRTSRCGHPGTSQLIINTSNETNYERHLWLNERDYLQEMRQYRDTMEEICTENAIETINETIKQDQIFQKFTSIQQTTIQDFPTYAQDIAKGALREKFGRWLIEFSSETNLTSQFELFSNKCQEDPKNTLIDNPVYYVQMANRLLKQQKKSNEAINYLNKATEMDPHFSAPALYSRAYARALQYRKTGDICRLKDSISDFKEARRIIREIMCPSIQLFPADITDTSPLHEYLTHVKSLYCVLLSSIDTAIGHPIDEEIKNLENQLKNPETNNEQQQQIKTHLDSLKNNRNQIENGVLGLILNNRSEIKIELKTLMKSLPSSENKELYKKEIEEFERNGFIGIITFNERKPIDWWSVTGMAFIGLGQILSGIHMTVFSAGACIGLGYSLLQEGISDLITCVRNGIINRNFSWIDWGIQKACSLAMCIFSHGLTALKAAGRSFVNTTTTTVKNVFNCSLKQLWTETLQEGIQVGGKKLALECVRRVSKEASYELINYLLSDNVSSLIHQTIQKCLTKAIQLKFSNNKNLHRLIMCDSKRRNRFYANHLKNKISTQLHEKSLIDLCLSVSTTFIRAISTYSDYKMITITATITDKLAPIIKQVYCLIDFIDNEINTLGQSQMVQDILDLANQEQQLNDSYSRDSGIEQAKNEPITYTIEEFCSDITDYITRIICRFLQESIISQLVLRAVDVGLSKFDRNITEQLYLLQKRQTVLSHQIYRVNDLSDNINTETLTAAKLEINNVRSGAPGQIYHIGYISQATNRRVVIYNEQGRVEHVVGRDTSQPPIEIMFHTPNQFNKTGYWTTVCEENKEQSTTCNCLFEMISTQTGYNISQIKQETAQIMEANQSKLPAALYDLKFLQRNRRDRLFFNENCSSST